MNIAIGARTLHENPGDGITWFTYETVKRIVRDHPDDKFFLITDKRYNELPVRGSNVEYVYRWPRNRHPVIWYLWHQFILPPVLKKIKADIFIGPDGIIPLNCNVPCISVMHDLNHCHRPHDIPFFTRTFYRYFFPRYAFQASRVLTVSEYSAKDISETYSVGKGRIDVAYNGVSEHFSPVTGDEKISVLKRYTGGCPYFLFVSNFSPRKNVITLIQAFELYCKNKGKSHRLVLAGSSLYLNKALERRIRISPCNDSIIFTGRVNRDELRLLYGSAEGFVFVPWFEGFGIPVVEAMRCGTPCIVSDNSSLPEVSGGAGLCVSAADAEAIAGAMARLTEEPALRRQLADQGMKNSMRFSWDKTAIELWDSIYKTVKENA